VVNMTDVMPPECFVGSAVLERNLTMSTPSKMATRSTPCPRPVDRSATILETEWTVRTPWVRGDSTVHLAHIVDWRDEEA
jgi:hypothetical protein